MNGPLPLDVSGRALRLADVDLDRFFHPRTVAVIGASDVEGRPATAVWRKIAAWSRAAGATIHAVNPNRAEVDGRPCLDHVSDVPGPIDLAVILVGDAVTAYEQVAAVDPAFVVIFSAGFAETGPEGRTRQAELEVLVAAGSSRLLGPNTNLNAFESFDDLPGPKTALITQSGHQGRPIFQAQALGLALSHWAPTGNEADLEFADFARYFADQSEVGVIAAYIEGFKNGRTLQLAADHCARAGVPLVMVKIGRTDEGTSMATSHTGHLAGSDRIVDEVFRQYGVLRVDGLDELQDTAAMLARSRPPTAPGVAIYSISGGTGAHMADLCAAAGLQLPALTDDTQATLRGLIAGYLRVSNPVDCGGPPAMDERGRKILDALIADPGIGVIICPITGALPVMSTPLARDLVAAAATTDKPICVVWGSPVTDEAYDDILLPSRLPLFRTFGNCVQAVRAYLDHHRFTADYVSPFDDVPTEASPAGEQARALLATAGSHVPLNEHQSKAVLRCIGIETAPEQLCTTPAEAVDAFSALTTGTTDGAVAPVVMKICSADIAHKSDHGLVRLAVASPQQAAQTFTELTGHAAAVVPDAAVDGVLVAETIVGIECVLGIVDDVLFGPTVMFGSGGTMVELYDDVSFRVPPFDRAEARRMIEQTRGAALFHGHRGGMPIPLDPVVDALMGLQILALEAGDLITELDINPLIVTDGRAVAVDALVSPRIVAAPGANPRAGAGAAAVAR